MTAKLKGWTIPPFYLRNPVLQTVLSSMRRRNKAFAGEAAGFEAESREVVIDAGGGVRLTGFYTEAAGAESGGGRAKGLIILMHGWEGSESSAYMIAAGRFFYRLGYNIFRLNLRDHGNSHHLNRGLFLGTLIEEAHGAVNKIIKDYGSPGCAADSAPAGCTAASAGAVSSVFIIGFSMGGNFALRIASRAGSGKDSGITKVIAVNPPLNPMTATENIDRHFIIRKYFLKKWLRSLEKKQQAFPDLYNFEKYLKTDNCIDLTRELIEDYSEYSTMEEYFGRYTLRRDFFSTIRIPVSIITAADDPVINISEFDEAAAAENPHIDLQIEPYGGHCAYIKDISFNTWLFDILLEKIQQL